MTIFHKCIDDIRLEDFANEMDEVGIETSGREVEGQGSDSELETDEDTDDDLLPPVVQERMMQKDHLQKAALKDMQEDVVRTMVKE